MDQPKPPVLRYVVLHHEGIPQPHFDLLFETAGKPELMSVRCSEWPVGPTTQFQRLPPHRRLYLDYEGPISGSRGHVRRIASGLCSIEVDREDSLRLTLDTGREVRLPGSLSD
jgi:hypothetical protein